MIGVLDHQVHIERKPCEFVDKIDHRRTKGDIVDEVAVHDVAMNPIGPGGLNFADFIGEIGEVCGEDGWGDEDHKLQELQGYKSYKRIPLGRRCNFCNNVTF